MRALIQRGSEASVSIDGARIAAKGVFAVTLHTVQIGTETRGRSLESVQLQRPVDPFQRRHRVEVEQIIGEFDKIRRPPARRLGLELCHHPPIDPQDRRVDIQILRHLLKGHHVEELGIEIPHGQKHIKRISVNMDEFRTGDHPPQPRRAGCVDRVLDQQRRALGQRFAQTALRPAARVEGAGHSFLVQIDEDVEDFAARSEEHTSELQSH